MEEEIDVETVTTGTGTETSSSGGGRSRNTKPDREPVFIKKEYGTEMFEKDTDCRFCEEIAEGVLRYRGELLGEEEGLTCGWPLCTSHRRELEASDRYDIDGNKYEAFEVDDE